MDRYYPESKVEIQGFMARHYDAILNVATLGRYSYFIKKTVASMKIKPQDRILDLGAGTGRNACLMLRYLSNDGGLTGVDISGEMTTQFKKKCAGYPNVKIVQARIDRELPFREKFDKAFISFVFHGFPQTAQEKIIKNVSALLKNNGSFFILDYNEFSFDRSPLHVRLLFKRIECPYAFDFIRKDWKHILEGYNFGGFAESLFFGNYVRLLEARKID
jgi:ubiquinone/menaquinone biosynthesis C-methylase UbiE